MSAAETIDLIESRAAEAFLQLSVTADQFERYQHSHALRIASIADALAKEFHLARRDRASLHAASLLHDIGEVAMERDYIQRAGPLMEEDRIDLARHPVIGEREASRVGADRAAQLLVRWHHEWWNGCGYPDALRRDEIPLAARILRLADSYAALTDDRPFRPAITVEVARQQLGERAGIEFDPTVVAVFLTMEPMPEFESHIRPEGTDTQVAEKKDDSFNLFSTFMR
jgi:HD-GYP domain-containing protein (c-di-GMP phosphodiesterase class II)